MTNVWVTINFFKNLVDSKKEVEIKKCFEDLIEGMIV